MRRFIRAVLYAVTSLAAGGGRIGHLGVARAPREPAAIEVGEELEYRVTYWFITLGSVRYRIVDSVNQNEHTIYRVESSVESNPSLRWLTQVHKRCSSEMDELGNSYSWTCGDSSSAGIEFEAIHFDYPNERVFFDKGRVSPSGVRTDAPTETLTVTERNADGVSLMYRARMDDNHSADEQLPAFIGKLHGSLHVRSPNEQMLMPLAGVDHPIDVRHFTGRADFVGVAGLTGPFEIWVSNDAARVPIAARFKLRLGSIKGELAKWKRGAWSPPARHDPLVASPSVGRRPAPAPAQRR